jgi:hypothetical protein
VLIYTPRTIRPDLATCPSDKALRSPLRRQDSEQVSLRTPSWIIATWPACKARRVSASHARSWASMIRLVGRGHG